ncbi:geranylgeranylglyceryl/heptaprenylglyceryl phosphate synthase [Croceimicrobium sp.]|uniref:geranylgeranylglyceryl/heptaprenylglyceryl phosphate synthase n=1 Tax=Croceimicrobium sp. TaxID=2828340 RepID=UPI003BA9D35D
MEMPKVSHIIDGAQQQGKKMLAVLIDPDKPSEKELIELCIKASENGADLIFVGGSLLSRDSLEECLRTVKAHISIPVLLFPGSVLQISDQADGILFLSLISGRNPDLLIGNHVIAAPYLKSSKLEVLPTAYMLVDCGTTTTAIYMSNSKALPYEKPDIAACTAMAGEFLGLRYFYLDGGSGAEKAVSPQMMKAVRKSIDRPIIVGGGIRDAATARSLVEAGADVIVVGNLFEKNPEAMADIAKAIHSF